MMRKAVSRYRVLHVGAAALVLALLAGDMTWRGASSPYGAGVLMAQTNIQEKKDEILKRFRDKKGELVRSPDEMKQMLADIQKNIREKNMHFVVGINEMMKYKISQITGVQVPRNLEKDARVQSELGDKLWNEFMSKYREYLRKKSNDGDRYRKEKKRDTEYYEEIEKDEKNEEVIKKEEEKQKEEEYAFKEEQKIEEEKKEEEKKDGAANRYRKRAVSRFHRV